MGKNLKLIFIVALILRLILAPFVHHADTIDTLNWGQDLSENGLTGFYHRDIPDAGPPNYPPLYFLVNYSNQVIYENVKSLLWFLNTNVNLFPSNFYLWFESGSGNIFFNKLPGIFADLLIGYFIYKILRAQTKEKIAEKAVLFYFFLPPSWYLSAVWGQTDSWYILPLIISVYFAIGKEWIFSAVFYLSSLLLKPVGIFIAPIYLLVYMKNMNVRQILSTALSFIAAIILVTIPFLPRLKFSSLYHLYVLSIREVSGYLTANAMNVWSFLYGFDSTPDSKLLLFIPARYWGLAAFIVTSIIILLKVNLKGKEALFLGFVLLALGSFTFLTRMHERYYYPAFIFLIIFASLKKKYRKFIYISAGIFTINLYHFWWMPSVSIFKTIFTANIVESTLALANIILFFYLFRDLFVLARE
jgi:dolichyl-phosphate-mannose-protein mannosyltransferase